jgi:hypothetical protein
MWTRIPLLFSSLTLLLSGASLWLVSTAPCITGRSVFPTTPHELQALQALDEQTLAELQHIRALLEAGLGHLQEVRAQMDTSQAEAEKRGHALGNGWQQVTPPRQQPVQLPQLR